MTNEPSVAKLITECSDAIGAHDPSDWELSPHKHVDEIKDPRLGGLRSILSKKQVVKLMDEYVEADKAAMAAQDSYLGKSQWRIGLLFIALAAGASALIPLDTLFFEGLSKFVTLVQFAAILAAIIIWYQEIKGNYFNEWQRERSSAELARASMFRMVLDEEAAPVAGTEKNGFPLTLQKLEYVRRYHIELQYAYYSGRGSQHVADAKRSSRWLTFAFLLGVISMIPLVAVGVDLLHRHFGVLGSLASHLSFLMPASSPHALWNTSTFLAVGTFAVGLEASLTNIFRVRNQLSTTLHFHQTAQRLAKLYQKLGSLRMAAAQGQSSAVRYWFTQCNQLITDEHRKWRLARDADYQVLPTINDLATATLPVSASKGPKK